MGQAKDVSKVRNGGSITSNCHVSTTLRISMTALLTNPFRSSFENSNNKNLNPHIHNLSALSRIAKRTGNKSRNWGAYQLGYFKCTKSGKHLQRLICSSHTIQQKDCGTHRFLVVIYQRKCKTQLSFPSTINLHGLKSQKGTASISQKEQEPRQETGGAYGSSDQRREEAIVREIEECAKRKDQRH